MKKMYTLLLSCFLLCLQEVMSLRCNSCSHSQQSKCMHGQGSCIVKNDEACATIYYKRNKHVYSKHMCKYKCKEKQSKKRNLLRVTICCYKNLCNIARKEGRNSKRIIFFLFKTHNQIPIKMSSFPPCTKMPLWHKSPERTREAVSLSQWKGSRHHH